MSETFLLKFPHVLTSVPIMKEGRCQFTDISKIKHTNTMVLGVCWAVDTYSDSLSSQNPATGPISEPV
jgi:hypothetical protein